MKISFGIGMITAIIGILIGFILKDWSITEKVCGYIGIGCILLVGVFNGTFISGDKYRGNYATETPETRKEKNVTANHLFMISIPNIITAIYFFISK